MSGETAPKAHDADQAGGEREEVFSSDGGDPLPVNFPPKIGMNNSSTDGGDVVDSESMSAQEAFEIFSGKLFVVNPYNKKPNPPSTQQQQLLLSQETPLQRLGRLQRELAELQDYVAASFPTEGHDDDDKVAFQQQIKSLRDQWFLLSEAHSKQHQRLTSTIQASVDGLANNKTSTALEGTIVALPPAPPTPALEERLKRLELSVGANAASTGGTVVDRLGKLEKLQSKLDEKQSEQLQKRAKVIRQDLEAAAKARNKLMAVGSAGGGGVSAEDNKTISALYDQLQTLQGMSDYLPVLTQRLQVLAQHHAAAATWESRLQATEALTGNISNQLQTVETAIHTMDQSLQKNAKQMQQNITSLDERIAKISK